MRHTATWTADGILIAGGADGTACTPSADLWPSPETSRVARMPGPRRDHVAIRQVLMGGTSDLAGQDHLASTLFYDPDHRTFVHVLLLSPEGW